ncbi:MaoC family dehydratase N-terminal domain-containing protein, partial [Pseudoalteromonas sp. SIMBA_162]|uniref:FAS1-like dehydratase domain-containing protein n=1 Tax=Pseudoalteromonas sp. SIMBA_162 TaxID=3080867 RepID=UPI003977EBDB
LQLTPNQVLHGEQSYQYYEDVYEGDIITSQLIVKDQYKKNGKTFFKIETIYKNQRNTVVAISQATLILIDGEANDGASDD